MKKPDISSLKLVRGRHGRQDRYHPDCPFSQMLCELIRRTEIKTACCLTQWQVDKLQAYGFKIEVEEE